jgi:hypothetical protein
MKSRLISKKPADDSLLKFKPMGAKPVTENVADAKKVDKTSKKSKKLNKFAKKAAKALANKN